MSRPLWRTCLLACLVAAAGPVLAQFGQNKISYQDFDWKVYESPHFNVHYYPAEEPFLEEVVSYAESAYVKLSNELDHELRFRVPLVIFKTHGEFQQTNITLSELPEGVAAFAEPVQNRMVLPIDLPPDELYQLIAHELTHIFQYSMWFEGSLGRALRSDPPTWLIEGMASYFAQDESNLDRMFLRDAVANSRVPRIEELDVLDFMTYRYGHAIFDFIEQEQGKEGLRTFLFEFRKVLMTNNLEKAIKESFGYDIDTFNRRFTRFLRQRYFPALLERKEPGDYGTEVGVKRPGVITVSPALSPSGELIAVLSAPKLETDLLVLSAEDGKVIHNLTKGWSNDHRGLVSRAFRGKRDLSWSPTSDAVAVFARRENRWPLIVYNAINGKKLHDISFADIVECASPAFSPDGRRVAFEGNRDGVVDLFEVDLETREVRNLTQDDFFDANPWYAPDGRSLLYNRRIGSQWKIFSVDTSDPQKKTQMTFGTFSDIMPSLSLDGTTVYFSSDRGEDGVFNLHALDLQTGGVRQYTDVLGGCFAPLEVGERDGDRHLLFQAFHSGEFRLYRMPLLEPEREIDVTDRPSEPGEAVPFEPPLTLRVDETLAQPYKLKWDLEAPYLTVGVADDNTFLTDVAVQFADLMGDHRFQILASSVSEFANYRASYINLKHRYNWGASIYDYRDYIQRASGERDQSYRERGVEVSARYPISRYYRITGSTGFLDSSQDSLVVAPTGLLEVQELNDQFMTFEVALTGDTTRFQRFGPFQGKRFTIGTLFAPMISGDSEGDIIQHRLDFRAYKQLSRRSLLAWRLATVLNTGERENTYGFGGINQLRGYEFRDFIGSRLAWSNLELRFPLIDQLDFPIMRLIDIRGFFFLDVGAAWLEEDLFYDPELYGIGALRLDGNNNPIPFDFWDSERDQLQDGRASYGGGFQFFFIGGLQFNWVWSKRLGYTRFVPSGTDPNTLVPIDADTGSTRMDFYIAFDF